jgi:hypothetical protein
MSTAAAGDHVRRRTSAPSSLTRRTGQLERGRTSHPNVASPTWVHVTATRESLSRLVLVSAALALIMNGYRAILVVLVFEPKLSLGKGVVLEQMPSIVYTLFSIHCCTT